MSKCYSSTKFYFSLALSAYYTVYDKHDKLPGYTLNNTKTANYIYTSIGIKPITGYYLKSGIVFS